MEVIYFKPQVQNSIYTFEKPAISKCLQMIAMLETLGNKIGMPYSKKIAKNLYELRIKGNQQVRILYCFHDYKIVIVHIFIKKTQKTPRKEIKVALERMRELTRYST